MEKVNPFLPNVPFLAPIDSKFGPDGSMYVLDWGGGYGRDNPTSGLYRIDYISGSRSPKPRAVRSGGPCSRANATTPKLANKISRSPSADK